MLSCVYADSLQYTVIIYVNREERGRSAAHGDACRAAEALFVSWVVEMGAWDVCEAVGTVAVAHRGIVPRRWPRGHFWDRGANFGLEGFATALMGGQRLMARLVPWFALRVMGAL